MTYRPTVVYPVEITTRELDGVLLTALKLACRGARVLIGPKVELDYGIHKFKPDVYIGTRATNDVIHIFRQVKRYGGHVCIVDTEGGVFFNDFYLVRHETEALAELSIFFATGENGKKLLVDNKIVEESKIIVSGVPWFDLHELRGCYSKDRVKIEREYPNSFIMYNSSLGNVHPKIKGINATGPVFSEDSKVYMQKQFNVLMEMLEKLVNDFPNETFVLRPHPSEDHNVYNKIFSKYKNVVINCDYNVRSWLLASKLMVHNSCTTGIESALLKVPPIAYQEFVDKKYEMEVHNEASIRVPNYESLVSKIKELLSNDSPYELSESQREGVSRTISNVKQSASDIITEQILSLKRKTGTASSQRKYLFRKVKSDIIYKRSWILNFLPKKKRRNVLKFKEYTFQKFKKISLEELQEKQNQIAVENSDLGIPNISMISGYPNSFIIECL